MTQTSRGRRDPALLQTDGPGGPEIDLAAETAEDEQSLETQVDETYLLDEGDVVISHKTLAVTLLDNPKESYFGCKVATRVREGEDAHMAAARARHVALVSIIDDVEETENVLIRQEEEREARIRAATGITRG